MVKRLEQIDKINNQNKNNIDNIQRINITINAENFMKNIIEIPILVNYLIYDESGGGGGGEGG